MQESCLIIGLAEIGNAVTANFSRSCSIAVLLHRVQNFSFPILNDFDSHRRQSYSRDYCSCFSTCNGVRWSECSGSFISGQDACSVKSKYLISVFASFTYVRNIVIVNVIDNGKIRCCFRENMCYLCSCCVSIILLIKRQAYSRSCTLAFFLFGNGCKATVAAADHRF